MAPAGATAGAGLPGAGAGMQGMSEQEQAMVKAVSQYTPESESSTWTRGKHNVARERTENANENRCTPLWNLVP